jgi:hypothetical protein
MGNRLNQGLCDLCGQLMATGASCTKTTVTILGGAVRDRVPHRNENGEPCRDCGVAVDGIHHHDDPQGCSCMYEVCPVCNGQLFLCVHTGCGRNAMFPHLGN